LELIGSSAKTSDGFEHFWSFWVSGYFSLAERILRGTATDSQSISNAIAKLRPYRSMKVKIYGRRPPMDYWLLLDSTATELAMVPEANVSS
jgi:hypothetical protein